MLPSCATMTITLDPILQESSAGILESLFHLFIPCYSCMYVWHANHYYVSICENRLSYKVTISFPDGTSYNTKHISLVRKVATRFTLLEQLARFPIFDCPYLNHALLLTETFLQHIPLLVFKTQKPPFLQHIESIFAESAKMPWFYNGIALSGIKPD